MREKKALKKGVLAITPKMKEMCHLCERQKPVAIEDCGKLSGKQEITQVSHILRFADSKSKHDSEKFSGSIKVNIGTHGSTIVSIGAF